MPRGILLIVLAALAGCGGSSTPAAVQQQSGDVFGSPIHVPLLEAFQGAWQFDFERTLATWKQQGVSPEAMQQTRDVHAKMQAMEAPPELERALAAQGIDRQTWLRSQGTMHEDLTIEGHVATGASVPSAEYRFFSLHEHDGATCGKAWHHEDRFDYGDMSKCHVVLQLVGAELHLEVRMQEQVDLNDPDLIGSPDILLGSSEACDAPAGAGSPSNGWVTYVFVRGEPGPTAAEPAN